MRVQAAICAIQRRGTPRRGTPSGRRQVKPWLHWSQLTAGRLRVLGSRSGRQGINQGGASDWKVISQVMRAYLILRRTAILMLHVPGR